MGSTTTASVGACKYQSLLRLVMSLILLLGACDAIANGSVDSQSSKDESIGDYFSNVILPGLSLTYTTANYAQSKQPATVQFVDNMGGSADSYAINGALTANVISPDWTGITKWIDNFGPTIEYHKNNTTTKPQDNLQMGLTAYSLFDMHNLLSTTNAANLYVQETLKYVVDNVSNRNDTIFPQLDISAHVQDWACSYLVYPFKEVLDQQLGIEWIPDVGVQYQSGNNIDGSKKYGAEARFKASGEFDAYPFAKALTNKLRIYVAYTRWQAAFESGYYSTLESGVNLFTTGIGYYLDDKQHVSIGCDYSNGENPETGLAGQKTLTVSLQAHF